MVKIRDKMDAVKIESYKDCVWYLQDLDKCKLTIKPNQYFECTCKDGMNDLCIWITKFLKSSSEDISKRDIRDDTLLVEYGFLLGNYDPVKKANIVQSLMDAMNEEENSFVG